MVNGGFTNYAHLRLREAHPGPCQYELKPVIGSDSDSLKKSIFNRPKVNGASLAYASAVGPGTYNIASSIGSGRTADFGLHLPNNDSKPSSAIKGATSISKGTSAKSKHRSHNASQRCLKTMSEIKKSILEEVRQPIPGSHAFTMRGRLKGYFDVNPSNVCLGAYTLPSCFDSSSVKKSLKGTFGGRYETHEEREKKLIPGPGTYNVTPTSSARAISILDRTDPRPGSARWKEDSAQMSGSGPGAYGDPTTISHRLEKKILAHQKWTGVCTFGSRPDSSPEEHRSSRMPGPGAYNVAQGADFLDTRKTHTPVAFRPLNIPSVSPHRADPRKSGSSVGSDNGRAAGPQPYRIVLPSDFDHDCRKGVKMLGRNWADGYNSSNKVHVDKYDKSTDATRSGIQKIESFHLSEQYARMLPSGGRFASRPYSTEHSDSIQKQNASKGNAKGKKTLDCNIKDSVPGPGSYDPKFDAVHRRPLSAILSGSPHASAGVAHGELAAAQQCDANGVSLTGKRKNPSPGPGHYYPDSSFIYPKPNVTTFYKGDFHIRNGMPPGAITEAASYPGVGANYNDTTLFSQSIAGDVAHRLYAKSFGKRYPARALYQVCKQRDETTNTNCIYPNEYAFYFDSTQTNNKTVQ